MIAKVALIRRMPKKIATLDYLVPEKIHSEITIGSLVVVPFRNRLVFGLVIEFKENETEEARGKLKSIEEIVWKKPALNLKQISFAIEISEFYNTPLGFILQSCLPPLKKTKIKKIQLDQLDTTRPIKPQKPKLILYKDQEEKEKIYQDITSDQGQTLIICPETSALTKAASLLTNKNTEIAIISSEITEKQLFELWIKIRLGEIKIVVGTRRAFFMPWNDLRTVILDDEANPNHKNWDMAPRLHNRETAMMLSHAHGAKCFITTHTPSVESWYFAIHNVYDLKNTLSKFETKTIKIVDMKEERRGRNYGFLSLDLLQALSKTNSDIFIFLNRRGSSAYVGCRDCGFVAKCPQCNRGLVYHENTSTLECHFCRTKITMFLSCPKCHGANMIMYGVGTQLVENELKKNNTWNKKIIRIDSDTIDIYPKNIKENKIIIGTQIAWDKVDWDKIGLMVFLDADTSLFIPEYKMSENLWWQIRDAQFRLHEKSEIMIQTGHREHQIFSNLYDPEKFYNQEINERKLFSYPPFGYLIRLYHGDQSQTVSKQAVDDLYQHLQTLTKNREDITISSPLPFSPFYLNRQYWYGIMIKVSFEKYKQITKFLAQNTPDSWKFDPNPNNLLSF
jgi:primosomal protein N' (replication factor Y)